jgi:hypothetical protein
MCLRPPCLSRLRSMAVMVLTLWAACSPIFAAQKTPANEVPEEVHGVKIYQLPTRGGQPSPNPAIYRSLSFRDMNFDRLLLALTISLLPVDHAAIVEHIYFQDVKINGVPVHIESFNQEFKLSTKEVVDLPGPLNCEVIFADLDSMQPVRDIVDKDSIKITGESFVEVKLSSIQRLALLAKRVVIPVDLQEEVPLNLFRGNSVLKMTAAKFLDTLANPASAAAISMARDHMDKLRLDAMLGGKVKPALYLLSTEYTVRDPKSKAAERFSQSGSGFLVTADGKLLTAKRVIEPWKFDPQIGFLIEHLHMDLDKSSVKTYAWPAGAQVMGADGQPNYRSALSTADHSLKVLLMAPDEMVEAEYQDPDSEQKANLKLHAEGASDLALLQLAGNNFHPLTLPDASAAPPANPRFVLCSYPFGMNQPKISPRLLGVEVTRQGDALEMEHKADPGESGAPLLDNDGKVMALATSANNCVPIRVAGRLIP